MKTAGLVVSILTSLYLAILSILSARLQYTWIGYLLIFSIILVIILCVTGVFNKSRYPILLFGISLSLLYSISLMGNWVVGTDIQEEIWCSQRAMLYPWNPFETGLKQSNSSFVVGIFLPLFTYNFGIAIQWVYKIIPPLFLAGAVVFLYKAFANCIGELKGFFATLAFIFMPAFFLETVMIAKSMVAEFFLAVTIWAFTSKLNQWNKTLIITVSLMLCMLAHYTVGVIAMILLIAIFGIRLVTHLIKIDFFKNRAVRLLPLLLIFILSSGVFVYYYNQASDGVIFRVADKVASLYFRVNLNIGKEGRPIITAQEPGNPINQTTNYTQIIEQNEHATRYTGEVVKNETLQTLGISMTGQPPIVRAGLNMDFMDINLLGKAFRIVQLIIQLLIVLGTFWLFFRWRQYNFTVEFMAGILCSYVLLVCCIIFPYFSSIINMTRFYHFALFFLSPMFVLGVDFLMDDKAFYFAKNGHEMQKRYGDIG